VLGPDSHVYKRPGPDGKLREVEVDEHCVIGIGDRYPTLSYQEAFMAEAKRDHSRTQGAPRRHLLALRFGCWQFREADPGYILSWADRAPPGLAELRGTPAVFYGLWDARYFYLRDYAIVCKQHLQQLAAAQNGRTNPHAETNTTDMGFAVVSLVELRLGGN